MEIRYNVTGERRKALVQAIADITGARAVYKFMPTCNYVIDIFTVTKDGTLVFDDRSDSEEVEKVLDGIAAAGFECEVAQDADGDDTVAFAEDAGDLPTEEPDAAQDADSGDVAAPAEDAKEMPAEEPDAVLDAENGDVAAPAEDTEELSTEEPKTTQDADGGDAAAPTGDAGELSTEEPETAQDADNGDVAAPAEDAKEMPAEGQGADTGLTVSLPMDGFTADSLDRLRKLVGSKAKLIRKALGTTTLDIRTDDKNH